ncbi:hypothetical protein CgunFtcFv8_015852 [Champsocephalus gunnari]|uniref:Uncharacterized protein n=1 Tax=Champsocephalus gunnari TaxID=52237 RepID=A0AAN8H3P8_CHAGU|nr:hypothetical protein CgunFtcFv8_015852 [Champsocephalus gunnari]
MCVCLIHENKVLQAVAPPGGGIPGRRARRSGCYGEAFPLRAGAAAESVSQETPLTDSQQADNDAEGGIVETSPESLKRKRTQQQVGKVSTHAHGTLPQH